MAEENNSVEELANLIKGVIQDANTIQPARRSSDFQQNTEKSTSPISWIQVLLAVAIPIITGAVGIFSIYVQITNDIVEIKKDIETLTLHMQSDAEYYSTNEKNLDIIKEDVRTLQNDVDSNIARNSSSHRDMLKRIITMENRIVQIEEKQ